MKFLFFILLALTIPASYASSPDYEREQRLVTEISDTILDGEVVDLEAGKRSFIGIHTEAETPKGTIILIHGRGFHADWQDVIQPLRINLVEAGWSTLSIQAPVLPKEAKYYDYVPLFPEAAQRIEKAIHWVKNQNNQPIVLLAHSCGAHMAMQWVRDYDVKQLAGFIGLGMGATDYKQPMKHPLPLEQIKAPVLDLYGSDDYPAVKRLAPERLAMMNKAGNKLSEQKVLEEADHYFKDQDDKLTDVISQWLNKL